MKVVADRALDVFDAHRLCAQAGRGGGDLGAGEGQIDALAGERRLRREADQRALELANVRSDHLREEERHVVVEREALDRRLVAHDRHARLELGDLDVGDEPPREARHEPLFHPLQRLRVLVARDHDLAIDGVERVEGVEELFLRLLAASEELDVVDEEHVALAAVARAEVVHLVVLDGRDEVVREPLGRHVDDPRARVLVVHAVGNRVHEVGLAEAGAAADEERVVAPRAAAAGRRDRRGVRELVRRADHERGEVVLGVDVLGHDAAPHQDGPGGRRLDAARDLGGAARRAGVQRRVRPRRAGIRRRDRRGAVRGSGGAERDRAERDRAERDRPQRDRARSHRLDQRSARHRRRQVGIDGPGDLHAPPRERADLLGQGGEEVRLHPLEHELVLHAQREHTVGEVVELDPSEPLIERGR